MIVPEIILTVAGGVVGCWRVGVIGVGVVRRWQGHGVAGAVGLWRGCGVVARLWAVVRLWAVGLWRWGRWRSVAPVVSVAPPSNSNIRDIISDNKTINADIRQSSANNADLLSLIL